MKVMRHAVLCVAVVASVAACGGDTSHDAAPTGPPAGPLGTTESASPCTTATEEIVKSAAQQRFGGSLHAAFTVSRVLCFGDWAKVLIDTRSVRDANPPNVVLFHDDGGGWRVVQYGSGFNCTDEGVPPSVAAELEC